MGYFLLLDYDGTLTPIADTPGRARLSDKRRRMLKEFMKRPGVKMAVVSGRGLEDIRRIIGIPGIMYVGNHGFESYVNGRHRVHPAAKRFLPVMAAIAAALKKKIAVKGCLVEDKKFTLSVHYRLVKSGDLRRLRGEFNEAVRPWEKKVRITSGKMVFEVRPPFKWDKGKAVRWLVGGLKNKNYLPVYIGDDITDEDAFRAVKGKGIGVAVGRKKRTLACMSVKNVDRVYAFIRELIEQ